MSSVRPTPAVRIDAASAGSAGTSSAAPDAAAVSAAFPDPGAPVTLAIPDEAAMAALGAAIARSMRQGDRIGLSGSLGAGKTTLARAILRTLADDDALDVPSPTFTLVQDYALALKVRHVDLYRVEDPAAVAQLGLGEDDAAELIEWPREEMPITVTIGFSGSGRTVRVAAPAAWRTTLERQLAIATFLTGAGWGAARRVALAGDASTRRYERLTRDGEPAVLMDAPGFTPEPESYPARARLANGNPAAFLAIGRHLRERGLSAPATLAADVGAGLLLIEDLGDAGVAENGAIVVERYFAAAEALAHLHREPPPALPGGYRPPRFDADLAAVEVALFAEWYVRTTPAGIPYDHAAPFPNPSHPAFVDPFVTLWREAIDALPRDDDRLALRDFHSPNLLWLAEREGVARLGLIDYQDAMIAPSAFDMVSLAQDARVDVPDDVEAALVARYLELRPGIDEPAWRRAYHVIGAQRATRILGVFRRLNDRDGKPHYLAHLPRMRRSLAKNLAAEPSLRPLRDWFADNSDVLA